MVTKNKDSYFALFVGFAIIILILIICGCAYCNEGFQEAFSSLRVTPRAAPRATQRTAQRAAPRATQRTAQRAAPRATQRATQRNPVMPRSMTILRNFFGNVEYDNKYITI